MYQVLLVDDEPILQLGIRRMLEGAADYQICASARNGEEALQYLQAHPVDIVMTDLKMPVMDGITLIKELKRRQLPAPVIVLSNYSDFELVREALTEGASDYVLKLDLTAQTLLKHLDKLAANLNAVRRTRGEQGELLQSRLRTFFLELQTADDHIPDLPPGLRPPFLVFTVYFQDDAIKPGRLRRVLRSCVWPPQPAARRACKISSACFSGSLPRSFPPRQSSASAQTSAICPAQRRRLRAALLRLRFAFTEAKRL